MIRCFPLLLLSSCALLQKPITYAEGACGMATFATAIDLASQAGDHTIPRLEVDLSECIQVDLPLTCEGQARREAYIAWVADAAVIINAAADTEAVKFTVPAVAIDECPQ